MVDVINLLISYGASYISSLEIILSRFFYLPIFPNIYLGPLLLFFIICGFVFHWVSEFIGGDDHD